MFGTRSGNFGVATTNIGNTPLHIEFEADDPDDHLTFRFDPLQLGAALASQVQAAAAGLPGLREAQGQQTARPGPTP